MTEAMQHRALLRVSKVCKLLGAGWTTCLGHYGEDQFLHQQQVTRNNTKDNSNDSMGRPAGGPHWHRKHRFNLATPYALTTEIKYCKQKFKDGIWT